ncbi:MAG: nuclear transport factor 2 family protein [Deltaproteobacteria bacterium]|jgi:hypothetical protein|nr:nuclear transport factor 2 family protein [Deltaproteobacteria bacterium]
MTTLSELERRLKTLEETLAITQLKHRCFRLLDQQEWDALRACFTDDVETHYESGHFRFSGIDEVMRFLSESLEGLRRDGRWGIHLGHHPEIEILSETHARGRWTLHAAILDRGRGRAGRQDSFYEDEYRKDDGLWRISRIGYTTFTQGSWEAPGLEMQVGDEADSRALNREARSARAASEGR